MAETVIVTDLSSAVQTVRVSDVAGAPLAVYVSDPSMLGGMQLERLESVDEGAARDKALLERLWEHVQVFALTAVDTELPTGLVAVPTFQLVGGRILVHAEGPVAAAFASTLIFKLQATKAGVTTLVATFTSTALAGGAVAGFWNFDLQITSLGTSSQRLRATFEYQAASGAKVRETFWLATTYAFDADVFLRLDGSVGAGTTNCDMTDAYHLGRRTGTW